MSGLFYASCIAGAAINLEPLRAELTRICEAAPQWDKRVCTVQATDSNERAVRVRFLISAQDSGLAFELRCIVREQMLAFITANYPHGLPRLRSTHDPLEVHAMQAQNDSVPLHKA